jgi:DNA-binding NarL/FixJ family response regulator
MTTVLLVDAPLAVRQALRTRLSLEPDLAIIGEADDPLLAISLAQKLEPDVVLLDAEAPALDASRVVHALTEQDAHGGIVVLTQHTAGLSTALKDTPAIVIGKHQGLAPLVGAIRSAPRRSQSW